MVSHPLYGMWLAILNPKYNLIAHDIQGPDNIIIDIQGPDNITT